MKFSLQVMREQLLLLVGLLQHALMLYGSWALLR
jgi:hypothetical protein